MATRWLTRLTAAMTLAVSFGVADVDGALAASCSSLKSQLASASRGSGKAAAYKRAAKRQRAELATTRGLAARAGCTRRATAQCKTLETTIAAMERRVADLDRKAKGGPSAASLKRRIARKGCDAPKRSAAKKPATKVSRRAAVAGAKPVRQASISRPAAPGAPRSGAWRTVCVRTCDGYFFPVSNSVSPQSFPTDVRRCASMCPRAETRLFVHGRNGGAETMFDRTGKRYEAMDYAFGHTKPGYKPNAGCTCGRPLAPRAKAVLRGSAERAVPSPTGMAPPAGDAETRRNASVDFGWSKAREIVATGTAERPARAIRVVGPTFLPDPAAAEAR